MKSLSSSPSSSSYSSTANFTNSICNSKSRPSGCFTAIFRRFLCFINIPTQTFDHIKENHNELISSDMLCYTNAPENVVDSASIGIVARLMGLDSMPTIDLSNAQNNSSSITRSRSMNSAENWGEFEPKQGKHRRVKSNTLSISEATSLLEMENEKFFVLSFKNGGKIEDFGPELRESKMGFGELKQRKTERCRNNSKKRRENLNVIEMNKENIEPNRVIKNSQVVWGDGKFKDSRKILRPAKNSQENSSIVGEVLKKSKSMKHKPNKDRGKLRKNRKENCSPVKKVETECDLENSSPVSVLDFVQFPVNQEVHPSEKDSRLASSNSRIKLSEKLKIYEQSSCCNTKSSIADDSKDKKNERKLGGLRTKESKSENYGELWGEICKLAEKDMMQCNCRYKGKYKLEDYEEIGEDFGLQILDQLLFELVDQLIAT
ncbi:hypothetical protein LguiA_020852 [Lonicera macranthoides]